MCLASLQRSVSSCLFLQQSPFLKFGYHLAPDRGNKSQPPWGPPVARPPTSRPGAFPWGPLLLQPAKATRPRAVRESGLALRRACEEPGLPGSGVSRPEVTVGEPARELVGCPGAEAVAPGRMRRTPGFVTSVSGPTCRQRRACPSVSQLMLLLPTVPSQRAPARARFLCRTPVPPFTRVHVRFTARWAEWLLLGPGRGAVGKGTRHVVRCLMPPRGPLGRSLTSFPLPGRDIGVKAFTGQGDS